MVSTSRFDECLCLESGDQQRPDEEERLTVGRELRTCNAMAQFYHRARVSALSP